MCIFLASSSSIWATLWQNQENGMCAQRRLRSARASPQSDQFSLSAQRKLVSLATHWAHSEDSDQTGLIWVFAGRTVILLVWSWGGSFLPQCGVEEDPCIPGTSQCCDGYECRNKFAHICLYPLEACFCTSPVLGFLKAGVGYKLQ